jgi:hypothetical protein
LVVEVAQQGTQAMAGRQPEALVQQGPVALGAGALAGLLTPSVAAPDKVAVLVVVVLGYSVKAPAAGQPHKREAHAPKQGVKAVLAAQTAAVDKETAPLVTGVQMAVVEAAGVRERVRVVATAQSA